MIYPDSKYLVKYKSGKTAVILGSFLARMFDGSVEIVSFKEIKDGIK